MSFTSDYNAFRQNAYKKKKTTGDEFTDEFINALDDEHYQQYEDLVPVKKQPNTADVAPVKEEEKDRTWFQQGALKDGVTAGNVFKAVEGTARDLSENVMAGILGIGESVVDAGAYLAGGAAKLFGNEDFADKTQEFIAKDLYDEKEVAKKLLDVTQPIPSLWAKSENSVLGERSDSLAQSAGQLIGTLGLQAAGVPWYVTTGATSFGSAVDEASKEGATFEEAGLSAAISAGAEILSEKLFGGSALGEKGLINLEFFTKGISSKVAKAIAAYGIDVVSEAGEEVFSQVIGNIASYLYNDKTLKEALTDEEAIDGYIEAAIGGAVLSGVSNVGKMVSSAKNKTDYYTGLNKNEEAVVEKVYNDRISEKEQSGEKLSTKDKAKIRAEVMEDLEKGDISIDDIEGALGGETYENYKNTVNEEAEIQREYDELYKMKNGEKSDEQIDRQAELKKRLEEIKAADNGAQLKTKLSEDVFNLAKGTKLEESYNERARKGEAFTADVSKYDAKQKEIVQKAIDSGILNNSRRTHEFVDIIAKISADKGVTFNFTDNAKLKESGFAIDGKEVNGFVTKDGVTLNMDSRKAWQTTVGHEITHVLEGTELYGELQNAIKSYAETKGEYKGKRAAIAELYKDVDADIDAELTADLVGEYLFTDSEFVNSLSTKHRNVFQKIYDEIKYLLKIATAGSKEARQLEKVKRAFDKAYKTESKAETDTAKYALSKDVDGNIFVDVTEDIFDGTDGESVARTIQRVIKERFDNLIDVHGQKIQINKTTNDEFRRSNSANALLDNPSEAYNDKLKTIANADEILAAAKNWIGEELNHERTDDIIEFARGNVMYRVGENGYVADVIVGTRKNGAAVLYDLVNIYEKEIAEAQVTMASDENSQRRQDASANSPIIPQKSKMSSGSAKFSLSSEDEAPIRDRGRTPLSDMRLETTEDLAPAKDEKIAKVIIDEPAVQEKPSRTVSQARNLLVDKQGAIEDLSIKTGNRELMAKADYLHRVKPAAQRFINKGADGTRALNDIRKEVQKSGREQEFQDYLYHALNIDRMSLKTRAEAKVAELAEKFGKLTPEQIYAIASEPITKDTTPKRAQTIKEAQAYRDALETKNKPVFSDSVTADMSRTEVEIAEKKHPEFKRWARELYDITDHLRDMMVDAGVISQDTADLFAEMYPHYIPVRRLDKNGSAVTVPLDTNKTGVNAPIKRATGGNSDIGNVFNTLAQRVEQTYAAVAKNSLGIELKNSLGVEGVKKSATVDEINDDFEKHDELLKKGENGLSPTFTVFENGERVEFEISEDIFDALKPTNEILAKEIKPLSTFSKIQRGLLTQYNLLFTATNAIKDAQSVLLNSQHAAKTYASMPRAVMGLAQSAITKQESQYLKEYREHGGDGLLRFDSKKNEFIEDPKGVKKALGIPLKTISNMNEFIETIPRLAEYIASRENGATIEVAMLDAARVTTNFAAGGDLAKFLNRNGFTFFNASIQGMNQQARNIREAIAKGKIGMLQLAAKYAVAGLPVVLFNALAWGDDEEYEELPDYVKDGYYIIGKDGDTFIRIPKGREVAVIQNVCEQMKDQITGDDNFDFARFTKLFIENLAPQNPFDNNVIAPFIQTHTNKTWYGEQIVPTRLEDLPNEEQFDESTDVISKWLGDVFNLSPYRLNYLIGQLSGGIGDIFMPMMTPEAESGGDSLSDYMIAPFKDKFTTNATVNNKNVGDFYDKVDDLTKKANSSKATDEDTLKYKYMNTIKSEMNELYQAKRELQNSDISNEEKHKRSMEIQNQIVDMMRNALDSYDDVSIDGVYATVGGVAYRWHVPEEGSKSEPAWQKITDKQLEKQEKVTSSLGISPSEYWGNKEEYDFAYETPGKYKVAKAVGGYSSYKTYQSALNDITTDKDANGKTISGSRKEKVVDYINNLDADYGEKIILYKSEYPSDDTYNSEIVEYLNERKDISRGEMETILKELGMTVHSNGRVTWD